MQAGSTRASSLLKGGKPRVVANLAGIEARYAVRTMPQNAAAFAARRAALGLTDAEIAAGFKSYPGLKHRTAGDRPDRRVVFINDSSNECAIPPRRR